VTVPSWTSQTGELLNPLAAQIDIDPGCQSASIEGVLLKPVPAILFHMAGVE
jgi:hypothetical protein